MTGMECYTNHGWLQISDKLDSLGFLKKATKDESNLLMGYENYAEVYGAKGRYFFAPISELTIPNRNYGLEVYDDNVQLRFSTAMKLLSFVKRFQLDIDKNKNTPLIFNGTPDYHYGVMYIKRQMREHYKYKEAVPQIPTGDVFWEYVVYTEQFIPEYRNGGLTIKYQYEADTYRTSPDDPGDWSGLPPFVEGFIVNLTEIEG